MDSANIRNVELGEISDEQTEGNPLLFGRNMDLVKNVKVKLEVRVGECELTVGEVFDLKEGAVLKVDRETTMPVDVVLDNKVIARGTLVAVDDNFGVCLGEILTE